MKLPKLWQPLREHIAIALVVGILLSGAYLAKSVYSSRCTATTRVSFVYPDIGNGNYPDGTRFTMYDFLDNERVREALLAMQAKGWYQDLTTALIQQNLGISVYLTDPVQDKVTSSRAGGSNFSYYSNEYMLSYHQPAALHLRDATDCFGLLRQDRSVEFLNELVRVNLQYFAAEHTDDGGAFRSLASLSATEGYDYDDMADFYTTRINACLEYLYEKENEGRAYTASSTGLSFKDLITSYEALLDIDINRFYSYINASCLTNQIDQLANRYNYVIETKRLAMNKKDDEAALNKKAMLGYDHTFTENLIVVAVNQTDGLYQARPKTAYDTVTQQTIAAAAQADAYRENIVKMQKELVEYRATAASPTEYARLTGTADQMLKDIDAQYMRLMEVASTTIEEYLLYENGYYAQTKTDRAAPLSKTLLAKAFLLFLAGAGLAIVVRLAGGAAFAERRREKKRERKAAAARKRGKNSWAI